MAEPYLRAERASAQREKRSEEDLTRRLVTNGSNNSLAEAYRTLRTNLFYGFVDTPPKVVVLTSPGPKEGKSTTCANLGVVLAQAGKSTLILDCDLRKPIIHKVFGLNNLYGVTDILAAQQSPQEVWHEPVIGLKIITVGAMPPNPAEIVGTARFSTFLAKMREDFDYILIDAPPVGLVSDAAIIATRGDGVLLVFDAQKTPKRALRRSVRSLDAVGANILGTVMNNVKVSGRDYHYYGDYGYA